MASDFSRKHSVMINIPLLMLCLLVGRLWYVERVELQEVVRELDYPVRLSDHDVSKFSETIFGCEKLASDPKFERRAYLLAGHLLGRLDCRTPEEFWLRFDQQVEGDEDIFRNN